MPARGRRGSASARRSGTPDTRCRCGASTVNLAPADTRKEGSVFDLPIALTAISLDAAHAVRPSIPLDDLAPPFLVQACNIPPLRRQVEQDRWCAVRGVFALGVRTRMLRGARIAVIGDVMTTGATLSECARVLRDEGGAAAVDAIVLARQPWADPPRPCASDPTGAASVI